MMAMQYQLDKAAKNLKTQSMSPHAAPSIGCFSEQKRVDNFVFASNLLSRPTVVLLSLGVLRRPFMRWSQYQIHFLFKKIREYVCGWVGLCTWVQGLEKIRRPWIWIPEAGVTDCCNSRMQVLGPDSRSHEEQQASSTAELSLWGHQYPFLRTVFFVLLKRLHSMSTLGVEEPWASLRHRVCSYLSWKRSVHLPTNQGVNIESNEKEKATK